ncbi:hypothetical protein AAG570_011354, partial [Ranatra chinensis]
HFQQLLEGCSLEDHKGLRRFYLTGNATCNDGSPAGYYLRRSHGSKRWIVFLEGGWYCYDHRSCHTRWARMRHLMSSKQWPDIRNVGGILSPNPDENPYWWNANHVFVPYCTSDSWSGQRTVPSVDNRFTFMGAIIIEQVIENLLPLGLHNATSLLLAGSSAGGAGVMLNLEKVKDLLKLHPNILVRGVSDSGWFLDRPPFSSHSDSITSVDAVKRGLPLWEGQIPKNCRTKYHFEPWRCYFGYRLYPTISAPLFVFQWLFDEAQMTADNVGAPVTKQQWDYIHKMGDSLRNTFVNVSAVFAPSCISHSVLTKRDWQILRIDDVSLPQALRCWELNTQPDGKQMTNQERLPDMLSDAPLNNKSSRKLTRAGNSTGLSAGHQKTRRRKNRNKKRGKKKRRGQRKSVNTRVRPQRQAQVCKQRLVERCSWPQCNHSCPKLHNPFTGEEMDFIELLKSFGLDMKSVANALGIDIHTLNNMDHDELLNLLTQQAN